jgi:hypothetical protein
MSMNSSDANIHQEVDVQQGRSGTGKKMME